MVELNDDLNFRSIKKIWSLYGRGKGKLQHLYTWPNNNSTVLCYGFRDGMAGKENKHELPPT